MKLSKYFRVLCCITVLALTGCAGTTATGPYYYLLSPQTDDLETYAMPAFKLGLGPVDLPTHLDREGIITYTNKSQLDYADNHRWAEPLRENVMQVLQSDLSQLLPNQQIIIFPWKQDNRPRYQIRISISQYGFKESSQVVLSANWTLSRGGRQLEAVNTSLTIDDVTGDYADIVNAQSKLLAGLAAEIALLIEEL